eukprot:TRINITY_DN3487_c0_g1_i5.p1 TRINITY_DN3487_c0_g1~~TRINITY_DN3487_c0_g1_i5.p1  ORF type:complete len:1099 (+),score=269.09 TRINITY_DN3487_c0_g1_i5:707-4003(+)
MPLLLTASPTKGATTPPIDEAIEELQLDLPSETSVRVDRVPMPIAEFSFQRAEPATQDQKIVRTTMPRVEPIGELNTNPRYVEIQRGTDLTHPPSNWLDDDKRIHHAYNPGKVEHHSREFPASALSLAVAHDMASHGETEGIDFIAPAENLKELFGAPYTTGDLSMSIHRIGQSLVIESGNQHKDEDTNRSELMSKLMYYSILAEDQEIEARRQATPPPQGKDSDKDDASPPPLEDSPLKDDFEAFSSPSDGALLHTEAARPPPSFYRNLKWHFQDLKLLLGSDQIIMQHDKGPEVALKLRDIDQPLTPGDAVEYWLDNVMNNVPQVAICYHKDGVTQGYQLISTNDIPTFRKEASFEPQVVQEYAGNVLHWLKENCKRDAGSYVLVREAGSTLKLYDLSQVYEDMDNKKKTERALVPASNTRQEKPFAYPVAMLCLRMGGKLADSKEPVHALKAVELLSKAIDLLPETTEPVILAEAHGHLATAHLRSCGISDMHKEKEDTTKTKKKTTPKEESSAIIPGKAEEMEGFHLAITELIAALDVLKGSDTDADKLYMERLIHCYIGLSVKYAAIDDVGKCLEWIRKAEDAIEVARKKEFASGQLALTAPPGMEPEHSGSRTTPEVRDPSYAQLATARLSETVGDVYQAVVRRLLSSVGNKEIPSITAAQNTLEGLLKQNGSSILHKMKELTSDVDSNVNKALEFYYLAVTQVARTQDCRRTSHNVEVVYSTQSDLKMKLGMMYNLWASNLIRTNRLSKASDQYKQAYRCFESVKDPNADINRATTSMNHGKLMLRSSKESVTRLPEDMLSEQEEVFVNQAISCFQDAVAILSSNAAKLPPVAAQLNKDAMMLSANAQLQLACRVKLHLTQLTEQQPGVDFEKRASDLLQSALKTFSALRQEESEAEARAHLGQLFMKTLRGNYAVQSTSDKTTQEQRQEKRFKYSEMYYNKAMDFYSNQRDNCMYLKLRREVAKLHLFHLTNPTVKKEQYLKTVVRTLTKVQPWFANAKQKFESGNEDFDNELRHILELVTDVLKEAVRIYSSNTIAPPKRAVSKQNASRLNPLEDAKELYSKALRVTSPTFLEVNQLIDSTAKLFLRND